MGRIAHRCFAKRIPAVYEARLVTATDAGELEADFNLVLRQVAGTGCINRRKLPRAYELNGLHPSPAVHLCVLNFCGVKPR